MEILYYLTIRNIQFCYEHLTDLVVLNANEKVLHGGLHITLNHICDKFWICQSRRVVNEFLRKCVVCKRRQGRTMKGLPPPDLPAYRLSFDYAFSNTGIDFAGPPTVTTKMKCLNVIFVYLHVRRLAMYI